MSAACGFKLRVLLGEGDRMDSDERAVPISLPSPFDQLVMRAGTRETLRGANSLAFSQGNYETESAAREAGLRFRSALLATCAQRSIAVDVGFKVSPMMIEDQHGSPFVNGGIEHCVPDISYGLITHCGEFTGRSYMSNPRMTQFHPLGWFERCLSEILTEWPEPNEKQCLALELYCLAGFESSLRARYITYMAIIELLAQRNKVPEDEIALIKGFSEQIGASDLSQRRKKSLLSRLGELRMESISSACDRLIGQRVGKEASAKFKELRKLRGLIVHGGNVPGEDMFTESLFLLSQLVRQTVLRDILNKVA